MARCGPGCPAKPDRRETQRHGRVVVGPVDHALPDHPQRHHAAVRCPARGGAATAPSRLTEPITPPPGTAVGSVTQYRQSRQARHRHPRSERMQPPNAHASAGQLAELGPGGNPDKSRPLPLVGAVRPPHPEPDQAALVRQACGQVLSGGTLRGIGWQWNAAVLLPPQGGKRWTYTAVPAVLTRPGIAGLSTHRGQIVGRRAWECHRRSHVSHVRITTRPRAADRQHARLCLVRVSTRRDHSVPIRQRSRLNSAQLAFFPASVARPVI